MQLLDYVTAEFRRIKRKQSVLLGLPQRALVAGEGDTTAADEDRLEAGAAAPAPRALVAAGAAAAWTRAGVHPSLYHWRHASCALYCQERRKSRAWKGSAN